ncbi:MAG TPA: FtsX-like permease family protein, partial [Candidatus Thermoplasmatota archaeon]|nr:FtsX-like permease family protein [Candidatus Thermoplasmatota archaeon]
MTVVGDLARAEWRARKRTYVVLLTLLAATSATYFLVLALVGGLEDRIGNELSNTLAGDVRLTEGRSGLGDGTILPDARDRIAGLAYAAPGSRFSPRLETEALFLHGQDFTNVFEEESATRGAGLLVGIDPQADEAVAPIRPYLVGGVDLLHAPANLRAPTGERLVPLVVGTAFLESTNVTLAPEGRFAWEAVYNITVGRFENGLPVTVKGIVVGTYATGFNTIDRFVIYAPRGDVAYLLGFHPGEPPANVILVETAHPEAVSKAAGRYNLTAKTPDVFRRDNLGPVFAAVGTFAWILVLVLSIMATGWIAHTLGHHVTSDLRKIATLRAIGIPEVTFVKMYLLLGAALGLLGGLAGVGLGALLAFVTAQVTSMPGVLPGNIPFTPHASLLEALGLIAL